MIHTPVSATSVGAVLRQLGRDRAPSPGPLAEMAAVRRSLEATGFEPTAAARQFEACRLIHETVERELHGLRASLGLRARSSEEQMRLDFSIGHRELESWSAVYHLYLRPDLNLSLRGMERTVGSCHRRTIQRRLHYGVALVTLALQELERDAVSAERREMLADLDSTTGGLVGVDDLVDEVVALLRGRYRRSIVALTGPAGIGKTALARVVAERVLAAGRLRQVWWIDAPAEVDRGGRDLASALSGRGGPGHGAKDPWRSLSRAAGLVVVDGVNDARTAATVVAAISSLPSTSQILLAGRVAWSAFGGVRSIEVSPLAPATALTLVRQEARARGLRYLVQCPDDALTPIVAASAGNPLVIREAVGHLRVSDVDRVSSALVSGRAFARRLYGELWSTAYEGLTPRARAVVRAVLEVRACGHAADVPSIAAATGADEEAVSDAVCELVDLGLLTPLGGPGHRHYEAALLFDRYLAVVEPGPVARQPSPVVGPATRDGS